MRGRKNMNAFSYSSRTVSDTLGQDRVARRQLVAAGQRVVPVGRPRDLRLLPVISDFGLATGVCSPAGAVSRCSYSYVQGS
jgi:hypothetical protein